MRLTGIGWMALLALSITPSAAAEEDRGRMRFVHAAPAAPHLDVLVNDARMFTDVSAGQTTGPRSLEGQVIELRLVDSQEGNPMLGAEKVDVPAGRDTLIVAHGRPGDATKVMVSTFIHSRVRRTSSTANLLVFHAAPDHPATQVRLGPEILVPELRPGQGAGPFPVPLLEPFTLKFSVAEGQNAMLTSQFSDGGTYLVILTPVMDSNWQTPHVATRMVRLEPALR